MDRHIFLIGMPGSGKSALGKRVAQKLSIPYLDTDVALSEITGLDTAELYTRFGEKAFRDAETRLLQMLINTAPGMISTGGGLCLREENQKIMHNHGMVVLINRPLDEILQDVRAEKRPFLAQQSREVFEKEYATRMPIYKSVADVVMDNGRGFHAGLNALEEIVRYQI